MRTPHFPVSQGVFSAPLCPCEDPGPGLEGGTRHDSGPWPAKATPRAPSSRGPGPGLSAPAAAPRAC